MLEALETIDRIFLIVAILSTIVVLLQAAVARAVWTPYLVIFLGSWGWVLAAVLL